MIRFSRVVEKLIVIISLSAGWFVIAIMFLTFFEVFMRYVVGKPPLLADEFGGYMLVGLSFLGLAYTWKEKSHVRIVAFVTLLPVRIASWLRFITLVFACLFTIGITHASWVYLFKSFNYGMRSNSWLRFPLQVPQSTLSIGLTFFSILLILEVVKAVFKIRSGESVEEELR